jgi:hypothetical protein
MPQPVLRDDDEILPALLPEMDGALFPNDFVLLDELTPTAPVERLEPHAVQVLADTVTGSEPYREGPPVLRLKILEDTGREIVTKPTVPEVEPPLEVNDWGPGPLGQLCCTIADWSDALADWIDRGNAAFDRARERAAGWRNRVVARFHRSR